MKAKEIRECDPNDIKQRLKDSGVELFNLYVQSKIGQLEKAGRIKDLKRDIARMKTILNEQSYQEKYEEDVDQLESEKK